MNRHHAINPGTNSWLKLTLAVECAVLLVIPSCQKQDTGNSSNNTNQMSGANANDALNHADSTAKDANPVTSDVDSTLKETDDTAKDVNQPAANVDEPANADNAESDANHNHMLDKYEVAKDQGADCLEKHNAGCIDKFCDSFLDYKCSTRCTSDDQCVSNEFFCRDDGRCVPKAFVSVWTVAQDNTELTFPSGKGEDCNYTIDWGDGSKESFTDCATTRKHTYAKANDYTISVTGTLSNWACMNKEERPFDVSEDMLISYCYVGEKKIVEIKTDENEEEGYSEDGFHYEFTLMWALKEIRSFGPVMLGEGAFFGAEGLEQIPQIDIPNGHTTIMSRMFYNATSFNQPLEKWDTSNVTNMRGMFGEATSFNQPLEKWNTSNVTNMGAMFAKATSFNQPLEKWNTSNVTDMSMMFDEATSFNQPLEKWNTSNVTDMSIMFAEAASFNQPLEEWNTSNVTDMAGIFLKATSFNQPLEKWNTGNVTNMGAMFDEATSFNQPLEKWDTSNVTDMSGMFWGAELFNQPLEKWNTSHVTNMSVMFADAKSFNQSLEKWDVSEVTYFKDMFKNSGLSKEHWKNMKKNKSLADKAKQLGLPKGY